MADCPKCPPVGAPLWLATFADLMSLLMCFFVLLLSFASMDANKFKKMSESMMNAFGVQRDIPVDAVPMGTSIIAQHFSPAMTEPTVLEEVKQSTNQKDIQLDIDTEDMETMKQKVMEEKLQEIEEQADEIRESLEHEIAEGLVTVATESLRIIIRINEKGSFPSGSAVLKAGFEPVMEKITESVNQSVGKVVVAGHTDDIPISTDWYRSNWELSAARSVTVAHFMLNDKKTDANRVVIQGFADTKPLVANDSAKNRAINRRVEIIIEQEDPTLNIKKETQIINSETVDDTDNR
jgi:chemotaxis protein MotB